VLRWVVIVLTAVFVPAGCLKCFADDWPALHHDNQRSGLSADEVRGPYERKWIGQFDREIITTRVEPIVADGKVFVGTYSGILHTLDAERGRELWQHGLDGPLLHSPACADGAVYAASAGGEVACLSTDTGEVRWSAHTGPPGYAVAPTVERGLVLLGDRAGTFRAFDATTGDERWHLQTGGPIRTTAAVAGDSVLFASDDMRAYCADLATGELPWRSAKLYGQSLRDYYPVVFDDVVALRSAPAIPMPGLIGADRHFLCELAGIDDSHWKNVDDFVKSDRVRVDAETHRAEQDAVLQRLEEEPHARSLFLLDLRTGQETRRAPVFWAAGCQGVGIPPVRTADGRAIIYYRTAYSNFSLGVAPVVGLGFLEPASWRVTPIYHANGNQPPWNTFWGTADESTNYSVGGNVLYICHQGTLSGLELKTSELFTIAGQRDTWGGESSLPWARNEWHGPARGAAAVAGDSLYWVTGSRVIAIRGRRVDDD